jgi:hypothetical protein
MDFPAQETESRLKYWLIKKLSLDFKSQVRCTSTLVVQKYKYIRFHLIFLLNLLLVYI